MRWVPADPSGGRVPVHADASRDSKASRSNAVVAGVFMAVLNVTSEGFNHSLQMRLAVPGTGQLSPPQC